MSQPEKPTRDRDRCCGPRLNAWLSVPKRPHGAMRLGQLSQQHPDQVAGYLDRMRGREDIATVAAEAFEVVERKSDGISHTTAKGRFEGSMTHPKMTSMHGPAMRRWLIGWSLAFMPVSLAGAHADERWRGDEQRRFPFTSERWEGSRDWTPDRDLR